MRRATLLVALAVLPCLAGCENNEGRGELLSGPAIDVHCLGQQKLTALPRGSIGDTSVKVTCPGTVTE